ncbi:MAG: glutamyl-tRNA(Gln) amidotransferase subunit E [Candidatus Nanoclepta minutus]|uniref:Glutamyl-tRNA(Gln) amidotransferase subunit E n=1 Tax=Candidatus Nanoclepta minutus TaxID=1940235 RepID=A0A397WQ17_9ARCH|nr:MAG: glutamyl-tRNA(Gln) amidotransferase subunit E [Candidatus Nanoclepta minutus]
MDYKSLGLKVGLEIHFQLDTEKKLFCDCPTEFGREKYRFIRELHPSLSELGEIDPAVEFEWKRGRKYEYIFAENDCLVEADEEPPKELNREALLISLAVAKALNMKFPDEIYVMRKIVIDGSNVSGFQRTALIAKDGYIEVNGKRIGIQTLCLEEDAARKVEERENLVVYNLDRLGVPLIEIATAPDIEDPREAEIVAKRIGTLVLLTGKCKRVLGAIRQDVNVSIKGGAKTEIKGVQYLSLIPKVVEYEVLRQLRLLEIRDELRKRGLKKEDLDGNIYDLTEILKNTKSKIIKNSLEKGGKVLGIRLKGFKGLIGKEVQPGRRFGTELSDYAKLYGVGGIFHSDELPAYGITQEEVKKVYEFLGLDENKDAFILVADLEEKARNALRSVLNRIKIAFDGIPEETRAANPDGTTRFMRPRPGASRMYPETDIQPIRVTGELLKESEKYVPEPFEVKFERFVKEYGLSKDLAKEMIEDIRLSLFEELVKKYRNVEPKVIASILINDLRYLRREGYEVDRISDGSLDELIGLLDKGVIAKDSVNDILIELSENPEKGVLEIVKEKNLFKLSREEVYKIVLEVFEKFYDRISEKRDKAINIIMSEVKKVVGNRYGSRELYNIIYEILKEKGFIT